MVAELPSPKSLRMTAIDAEGHIKVFLVMARPEDVKQLHKLLEERIKRLKNLRFFEEAESGCPKAPIEVRIVDTSTEEPPAAQADAETGEEPARKKAILDEQRHTTTDDSQD